MSLFDNSDRHARTDARATALACLTAGVEASHPETVIDNQITLDDAGRRLRVGDGTYDLTGVSSMYVVGGGNAAGAVAAALEDRLGSALSGGAVVTDDPSPTETVETLPGDHPLPSERSVRSTAEMRALAADAGADDLVLAVVAGGGSALMTAPAGAVTLADIREVTETLLERGAPIAELNAVRKHLSAVKGGQLARAAAPAAVVGVVFSDVVGDDPAVVASGPTAPDPTTYDDALAVLDRYDIDPSERVRAHLEAGAAGEVSETAATDADLGDVTNHVVATGATAVQAARDMGAKRGYEPVVLSTSMRGEAREIARAHAAIAEEVRRSGSPVGPPAVLVSGGELTVTVRGDGTGGPNQEFALAGALELPAETVLGSIDTDGLDGSTDAAGALVDADTVADGDRARRALADSDAHSYLDTSDALLRSGETGTNVNDLRVVVVEQ